MQISNHAPNSTSSFSFAQKQSVEWNFTLHKTICSPIGGLCKHFGFSLLKNWAVNSDRLRGEQQETKTRMWARQAAGLSYMCPSISYFLNCAFPNHSHMYVLCFLLPALCTYTSTQTFLHSSLLVPSSTHLLLLYSKLQEPAAVGTLSLPLCTSEYSLDHTATAAITHCVSQLHIL